MTDQGRSERAGGPRRGLECPARGQRLESLGQFTAAVAHDFNNLLAVIGNYAAFAAQECAAAAAADPARWQGLLGDIDQIRRAAERGAALTGQLLTFAGREAGQRQAVRLNTVVDEVLLLLRHSMDARIRITRALAPQLWPVLADPTLLSQALMNLVVNARDAMPEGGVLVIGTANLADGAPGADLPPGRYVLVEVADTGTGMPADVLERAFEPFFTTKSATGGTGLGLAMVSDAVHRAGGAVQVESEPGRGTRFRLLLPAAPLDP